MTNLIFRFQEKQFNVRVNTNSKVFKEFKDWIEEHTGLSIQPSQTAYTVSSENRLRACRIKAKKLNLEASVIQ